MQCPSFSRGKYSSPFSATRNSVADMLQALCEACPGPTRRMYDRLYCRLSCPKALTETRLDTCRTPAKSSRNQGTSFPLSIRNVCTCTCIRITRGGFNSSDCSDKAIVTAQSAFTRCLGRRYWPPCKLLVRLLDEVDSAKTKSPHPWLFVTGSPLSNVSNDDDAWRWKRKRGSFNRVRR